MNNSIFNSIILILVIVLLGSCQDSVKLQEQIKSRGENLIHFSRRLNPNTGELFGESNTFTLMNKGRVHASIDLSKLKQKQPGTLMLHFDWVDPEGKSFYQKRENIASDSLLISSSISINPTDRISGIYKMRLFLFRKLIAEKSFKLLPEFKLKDSIKLPEGIVFYSKINKKTTQHSEKDSVFNLMKKKWFTASTTLSGFSEYGDRDLLFRMEWYGNDSIPFYTKRLSIQASDSTRTISSAISLDPENRDPGNGHVDLFIFDKLIARKSFILQPPIDVSIVKSKVSLCSKVSKKTGKRSGFANKFPIEKKAKVYACFDLSNCQAFGERELNFTLKWINSKGKTFYTKRFDFTPNNDKQSLKSAISISPKKREVGSYKVQLYLYNELLSEKAFILSPALNPKLVKTAITLCTKVDKTTGQRQGVNTKFTRKKKGKIRAFVDVSKAFALEKKSLKFRLEWEGADGKIFYSKDIIKSVLGSNFTLKSSISISPVKRKSGTYKFRVYLLDVLLNEQVFELE